MPSLSPATKADLEAELQRRGINPYKPKRKPWAETARPEQLRPEGCEHFILLGGRGGGKTRAAAEDVLNIARQGGHVIHVLSPTYKEIKGVCMDGVGGSSLMELVDRSELMPGSTGWNQTDLIMRFRNGSVIRGFTAEEPGRLNGPQASHLWCDEFGLCSVEAIDMAMFGLRLGKRVTSTWSSTPKPRPGTKYVLGLFPDAHVSRMRTIDNAANLAKNFIDHVTKQYAGTRLGKAELDGELVEDVDGALWSASWFDRPGFRLDVAIGKDQTGQLVCIPPEGLVRIVVAIDPSVTDPAKRKDPHKDPDACGMIVAGVDALGRGYVLGDFTAIMAPAEWARLAIRLYDMCKASKIVAEANQGGELIREVLKSVAGNVPIQLVHASMGKRPRAEPVAMLFEQGRIFHCGTFMNLEAQMTSWDASDPTQPSPNNIDAMVWAFHALGLCNVTGTRERSGIVKSGIVRV